MVWSAFETNGNIYKLFHRQRDANISGGQWDATIREVFQSFSDITYPTAGSFIDPAFSGWLNTAFVLGNNAVKVYQYDAVSWAALSNEFSGTFPSFTDNGNELMLVSPIDGGNAPYQIQSLLFTPQIISHSMDVDVNAGWNIVSLPCAVADSFYLSVFPNANPSTLFGWDGAYVAETHLSPCKGYWLQFPATETVAIGGSHIDSCTIDLIAGWQLIGGPSCTVPVSSINDPGSILQQIFKFEGSYQTATDVEPGKGYWVNASSNGEITISCGAIPKATHSANSFNGIKLSKESMLLVEDSYGNQQTLYFDVSLPDKDEIGDPKSFMLPPVPPKTFFDARFAHDGFLTEDSEAIIELQASNFPITITSMNLKTNTLFLEEYIKDEPSDQHVLTEGSSIKISNPGVKQLRLSKGQKINLPREFAIAQNYPNPFNPTTTIDVSMPRDHYVILQIFDVTGRLVRTLIDGKLEAGIHQIEWNSRDNRNNLVSSGLYIYRIAEGPFIQQRKMILMR